MQNTHLGCISLSVSRMQGVLMTLTLVQLKPGGGLHSALSALGIMWGTPSSYKEQGWGCLYVHCALVVLCALVLYCALAVLTCLSRPALAEQ